MSRVFRGFCLALLFLAACPSEEDSATSQPTDPTVDFGIDPLQVDTGWPDVDDSGDTGYEGRRRRAPDSGWRLVIEP